MVIQKEEFNVKEIQCYNVLAFMNQHQDGERMISSDVKSLISSFLNPDDGSFELKPYNVEFLLH